MRGARSRTRPESASECSVSDEQSQLELYLRRQLEEDIARIFDESIYSDIEVVCGKLKILTHSCILKARTHTFYNKLETILKLNIERATFDEIYSFISDAYTECNIQHQEDEIITYLNSNLNIDHVENTNNTKQDPEDSDVFLTPKGVISPHIERNIQKSISSSPSTELTKEYYALVPIDGNLFDQELKEQDALLDAFQSIIKSQADYINQDKGAQRVKPTSLSLNSSHTSKTVKHSNSCDILNNEYLKYNSTEIPTNSCQNTVKEDLKINKDQLNDTVGLKILTSESYIDKSADFGFSPDSLLTDEPSSSSDYISAAYTFSPGVNTSSCFTQINIRDSIIKMDNMFTLSDSGCENTGTQESLSSNKDITITDEPLTESTLHELAVDEAGTSRDCHLEDIFNGRSQTTISHTTVIAEVLFDKDLKGNINKPIISKEVSCKSSKEQKQRLNEEIVIMESSSLSSETGSWESVFPPKQNEKEICETFLLNETQCANGYSLKTGNGVESSCHSKKICSENDDKSVQKSPNKSASCFIDAASLVEDDDVPIHNLKGNELDQPKSFELPAQSTPVPCSSTKLDSSPNDASKSIDNDDSLEQSENRDPDYNQKNASPTIFEMTPVSEDSLSAQNLENITVIGVVDVKVKENKHAAKNQEPFSVVQAAPLTPYNSILSLMDTSLKTYGSERNECDNSILPNSQSQSKNFSKLCDKSITNKSGEVSLDEDDFKFGSRENMFSTPWINRKLRDVSTELCWNKSSSNGKHDKVPKVGYPSSWVVDMSRDSKFNYSVAASNIHGEIGNENAEIINKCYGNKDNISNNSRSSIDSDKSERSSQTFYIDLSSLPDPLPSEKKDEVLDNINEKKNIFSMFIDLGDKSTVKEMPARLSSLNNKKVANVEIKNISKQTKDNKISKNELINESNQSLISFEKIESLCNDPNISISDIIKIPQSIPESIEDDSKTDVILSNLSVKRGDKTLSSNLTTTTIKEESLHDQQTDLFVKLSDLDKPVLKSDLSVTINEDNAVDIRMTRSIPDHNWGEQSLTITSRSIEVITSFHSENALSLNRLFPHLKNEFSKSLPGSLSSKTRSPLRLGTSLSTCDPEEHASDVSELSSVQSSVCRSVVGNSITDDTNQMSSLVNNCQSRLGQDLLRMFIEEIAPDVIVEVSGKRIKAHKCILSSRCQYFAGILSGGWVESAGNVIVLPTFSYNVVYFAMCHIYSGTSEIPDSISILELATLTDMLGLEGLKEAIMFTLKAKYCHHFHRPCTVCIAGVLECFPLSSAYGLDDLFGKILKWITRYFPKVWPTKTFATLPSVLLDKCYQEQILNLSTENLVETVYGCGITVASLQNNRWSEIVARMCRRLVNAAAHFVAPRLTTVLLMIATLPNDAPSAAKQALNDCFAAAIEWAPPDEACRAYAYLSSVVKQTRSQSSVKPDLITNGNQNNKIANTGLLMAHASGWQLQCEGALVRAAPRVVTTQAFQELSTDLRKRLRELGCIMYGAQAIPVSPSFTQDKRNRTILNKSGRNTNNLTSRHLVEQVRSLFVNYASKPPTHADSMDVIKSNNDIRECKKSTRYNPPKIRTTKAQEERAKFNLAKTIQPERSDRQKSVVRTLFQNTKPRYLEPKLNKDNNKNNSVTKFGAKIVSSSESSRNSSPIQARNMRASRLKARNNRDINAQAISQDSLDAYSRPRTAEPSTDSLSESQNSNKYATYTKAKHTKKTSMESVKSIKYQGAAQTYVNNKVKTKIPVYLNQNKSEVDIKQQTDPQQRSSGRQPPLQRSPGTSQSRSGYKERPHGSLMSATKSSSAKIATKVIKDPLVKCPKDYKSQNKLKNSRVADGHEGVEHVQDMPMMERSGTFLKDEPTFGDKTTNIDID